MATDPSIILSGIDYPTQLAKVQATQGNALKLQMDKMAVQQQHQQIQNQNALKAILSRPDAFGKNGQLTPETLNEVAAVDPATSIALRKGETEAAQKRATMAHANSQTFVNNTKLVAGAAGTAINTYDQHMAAGDGEDASRAAAQKVWDESYDSFGNGEIPDEYLSHVPKKFDPIEFRSRTLTAQQFIAARQKDEGADLREQELVERRKHNRFTEQHSGDVEEGKGWTIQHDPKTNTDFRYNARTGEATTLDMKPYQPQGAQKQMGGTPRSAIGMAMQKYMQENPDATAEEITKFSAGYTGATRMSGAIGTRRGQVLFSEAELENAAKLSNEAYTKLPRTQFLPFNQLVKKVETQTSSPEQAAAVAADNAVVNTYARMISPTGQGTVSDKEHAREMLNTAQSQEAHGAVVGQLLKEGLAARAGAKRAAEEADEAPVTGTRPREEHPPLSMLHEGRVTTFKNGQKWKLVNGRAVRVGE